MDFGNFLNLTGVVTMDFEEGLQSLDRFFKIVQAKAIEIEKSFQGIDTKGFSDSLVSIGANFAIALGSFNFAKDQMISGFSDLRQAGGDAFDYIGSRAKALAKDAIMASSEMENFNRTLQVHTRNQSRTASINEKVTDWEITSPWEMVDVQRATRKAVARGIQDPNEVMKYVKLASEMASVNDQDIGKAMDALMKIRARSPEAYRSLKQNFTIGPDQLKGSGVTLDSGDRLRMRTQGDADAVINALQSYYDKTTGMKASEQQATTVIGKWSSLQSQIWRTTAHFADIVAPKVKDLLDWIRELVKSFDSLSPTTKSIIAHFVGFSAAVFTLSAILAPIVGILSSLVVGLAHLTAAAGATVIGFIALRGAINGLGGLPSVLANISSALMGVASRAGAGAGAVTALGAAASSAGTKFSALSLMAYKFGSYMQYLSATPIGMLGGTDKYTNWADSKAILGKGKTASSRRRLLNRMGSMPSSGSIRGKVVGPSPLGWATSRTKSGPGTGAWITSGTSKGRSVTPGIVPKGAQVGSGMPFSSYSKFKTGVHEVGMTPPPSGWESLSDVLGKIGIAVVVTTIIAGFGTLILNSWSDWKAREGTKIEETARRETSAKETKRQVQEYIDDPQNRTDADRERIRDRMLKDIENAKNESESPENKLLGKLAEERKALKQAAGKSSAGDIGPPGRGYSSDISTSDDVSDKFKVGVVRDTWNDLRDAQRNSPLSNAEKALKDFDKQIELDTKKGKIRQEMTEAIIADERRVQRATKLGLLSREQSVEAWTRMKKRSIEAGMSEDDVAKAAEKLNTERIALMHEDMYRRVGIARDKDISEGRLSLEKKREYLFQETKILESTLLTHAQYEKNKKELGTDWQVANTREYIEQQVRAGNKDKEAEGNKHLQKLLAAPLKGKSGVMTFEQEKAYAEGILGGKEATREIKLRDDKLDAEDLASHGKLLFSKVRLARDAANEHIKTVVAGSKQEEQIRKQLHVTLKNLYLEDKIEFMKIAHEKAQFLRDLAKQTTTRETGLFEYEESRGRRDPARQAELREKSKKEQITEVREVAKAKIAEIDEQLRKEDLTVQQRKKYIQDRDAAKKTRDSKIKDIEQGSGITKQQQEDTKIKEDLENQYGKASNKATALEYRETLLQKRMSQAKTKDKVDSVGKSMEDNLKAQYETQAAMIDLKEKEDSLNKSQEQKEIIHNRATQEKLKLQETFLQKMQDVTAEMEKQKGMLDKGKSDFTMGGIYNSYEEIVKHDMETSDKFKSQYDTGGGSGANFDLARSVAAGKLGIPVGTLERTTINRGNELGVGGPENQAEVLKAQQDAAARQTLGMPKRIPLRGSASYDAMQAARALDAWGTFPIVPDGIHKTMISGTRGAGSEGAGGDQQITIPVTVNIGGQSYSQTQNQVVKKSAMNYKHPKGGI